MISLNKLDAFIYIINNFDLFGSAQRMLNYLGRPEFGTNMYSYNTEPELDEIENFTGVDGRKITPSKNLSYFDRMRGLE